MPRGIDVTFYRILWVTLVVVAVTFTVILTTVFVDIDGLLTKQSPSTVKERPNTEVKYEHPATFDEFQFIPSNENEDTDNTESDFRIKRSLESNGLLYHIKSPKIRKILTNHLATLLDELDEEDASQGLTKIKVKPKTYRSAEETAIQKTENTQNVKDNDIGEIRREVNDQDVLHLAMHNILLQGIIGHMDLNKVYKKIHLLVKSFDGRADHNEKDAEQSIKDKPLAFMDIVSHHLHSEEDMLIDEMLKCRKIHKHVSHNEDLENKDEIETDSPIIVKAVIDITNNRNMKAPVTSARKSVKGIIKLLYNGNSIQFEEMNNTKHDQMDKEMKQKNAQKNMHSLKNKDVDNKSTDTQDKTDKNYLLNQAIAKYISIDTNTFNNNNHLSQESFKAKRLKRQININYEHKYNITEKSKELKTRAKEDDDELFVEIETHFDSRGTNSDKKKKLVRSLIDKIQKAINSNIEDTQKDNSGVQAKFNQIKKRTQKPIDSKNILVAKSLASAKIVNHRDHNFISKTANDMRPPLASVLDMYGDNWKKTYNGPGFLTVSKSLNSAEMSELDVDYNSVMRNGIPKRLQRPLNTAYVDMIRSDENPDAGNATLYLKEIDGSGFTIGINQYVDEPPDKESLKMFTGLENLIQAYHENYDQRDVASNEADDAKRYKRGTPKIKLFSNLKSKTRLNKFLNTNAMKKKKIFLKSKRSKRHIDKIRIIASDRYPQNSEENIFLASHETISADRALVKEEDKPDIKINDRDDEEFDYVLPDTNPTYGYDISRLQPYITNVYDTKSLRSGLMSKYPHVFVDNISKSKDEVININSFNHDRTDTLKSRDRRKFGTESALHAGNNENLKETNMTSPNVDDIISAILPSQKNNYKLTVKILPLNKTDLGPGYKELHTSINKSYDNNGVRYISYINVSEISKYENVNNTTKDFYANTGKSVRSDTGNERSEIGMLLRLHKIGIDKQIENLKMESQKLSKMIREGNNENHGQNISSIIDVVNQLQPNVIDERKILSSIESTLNGGNDTETSDFSPPIPVTTIKTASTLEKHVDPVKLELINTIKRNENITRQMLEKIDQNTNVLQLFLQKISNKLQSMSRVDVKTEKEPENTTKRLSEAFGPLFEQSHRNFSNPIPFVYAFQPPIAQNKEGYKNFANVVYHGHIHANDVDSGDKYSFKNITNSLKTRNMKNIKVGIGNIKSRFFIDDLESDFKTIQDNAHNAVKTNDTAI